VLPRLRTLGPEAEPEGGRAVGGQGRNSRWDLEGLEVGRWWKSREQREKNTGKAREGK